MNNFILRLVEVRIALLPLIRPPPSQLHVHRTVRTERSFFTSRVFLLFSGGALLCSFKTQQLQQKTKMARYRSRSRSYSPRRRSSRTPPRGRKRYDDEPPRDRYRDSRSHRDRRSPAPSGLLVRNLPLDARSLSLSLCYAVFNVSFVFSLNFFIFIYFRWFSE